MTQAYLIKKSELPVDWRLRNRWWCQHISGHWTIAASLVDKKARYTLWSTKEKPHAIIDTFDSMSEAIACWRAIYGET